MKYLVKYIEDIKFLNVSLDSEDIKITEKNTVMKFQDFKVLYELSVWLVINCGEENIICFIINFLQKKRRYLVNLGLEEEEEENLLNYQDETEELEDLNKSEQNDGLL